MKKLFFFYFIIFFNISFAKYEKLYNIEVTKNNSNVGETIQYSTLTPKFSKDNNYFFMFKENRMYLNSFLVKVTHNEINPSKQFFNYFVLRVKKSNENNNTIIKNTFSENINENENIFIFSCSEKITENIYTPIYFNMFYRNGKTVSIYRLAKREEVKNLLDYITKNNLLDEVEKNSLKIFLKYIDKFS
ncbi:hypothetical protein [Fusobacterium sp.]|uniref:hypothetical protein n=1 Tax=Fusobacterium sp. TaxID=68766 RepID=UPI0025B8E8F3|nr:hypothetical protein [Fusobacterium sp.]